MEYWESKADDGLIYKLILAILKNRSHSTKPSIPLFQYSIIPLPLAAGFTAQPIISDLAQRTRFSATK